MAAVDTTRTPAGELAGERLDTAVGMSIRGEPSSYPSGAAFVPADLHGLGEVLSRYARERRPVVLVYPDGDERLLVAVDPEGLGDAVAGVVRTLGKLLRERGAALRGSLSPR